MGRGLSRTRTRTRTRTIAIAVAIAAALAIDSNGNMLSGKRQVIRGVSDSCSGSIGLSTCMSCMQEGL